MKYIGLGILLLTATLLTACEDKPYKPPVPKAEPDTSAVKLFEPQRDALDKARGVERTIEQAGRDREEAAEKAGR